MTKTVDELWKLVESFVSGVLHDICELSEDDETGRRAAIRSALEEVVADAERWVFVEGRAEKTGVYSDKRGGGLVWSVRIYGPGGSFTSAVDAAMQQAPEQEG